MDELMMKAMGLPVGFGKKAPKEEKAKVNINPTTVIKQIDNKRKVESKKVIHEDQQIETEKNMKSLTVKSDDEDDDDDDDDSEDDNRVDELPIKSFCSLVDHHKTVCCFSVDRANSRFITGGRDNTVKMWDFHGMSSVMKPFKSMEPEEGNPIRDIQFSNSGDSFLVAPSCWQPILYDKDGNEVHKFLKGDPYLRDFRHIKGHIAALTSLQWHPNDNSLFLTSSLDSTVRVWDVMDKKSSRNALFVRPKGNVGKDPITSAVFSHDGRNILAGDSAGHIRVWNSTTTTSIPLLTIDKAHMAGNPITCVQYSLNGHHIFSRSLDDTLKLWDLRNSKKSIGEANNVVSFHEEANAIYSPNERYILCGTSVKKDAGPGKVLVFDSKTLEKVVEFETATSCIRLLWPKKMNQIFAGLGNGDVQVLYDPDLSVGGVMVPLSKKPRKLAVDDYDIYMRGFEASGELLEPPEEEEEEKRDEDGAFVQPIKMSWTKERALRKPELPHETKIDSKGRGGTTLTQQIMKHVIKNNRRQEDPREAILKYAEVAKNDPYWISPAYAGKQDVNKPVLAKSVYEDEAEFIRDQKKRRRK